jgi:hypothetical protein
MRYKLLCASCMVAVAAIGAAPAYAVPDHGFECGEGGGTPTDATSYPGNSATSPGSIFNEPDLNSVNGGKGNQAYNAAGAPSQYDTACGRVTANGTGTPYPAAVPIDPNTNQPIVDVPNNSRATRDALGVVSHTGKGANK